MTSASLIAAVCVYNECCALLIVMQGICAFNLVLNLVKHTWFLSLFAVVIELRVYIQLATHTVSRKRKKP